MAKENWGDLDTFRKRLRLELAKDVPLIKLFKKNIVELDKMDQDLYEHTIQVVNECPTVDSRIIALFHDMGKLRSLEDYELYSIDYVVKYFQGENLIKYILPIKLHPYVLANDISDGYLKKYKLCSSQDLLRFCIAHEKVMGNREKCIQLTEVLDKMEVKLEMKGEVM